MTTMIRHRGRTSLAISLMAAVALAVPVHYARADSTGIVPPDTAATVTGNTYGAWSSQWWRYVLAQPKPSNPLLDPTGADCDVGQSSSSSVFYLVGAAGTGAITRTQCIVPANKYLFFPLVNAFDVHTPSDSQNTDQAIWNDLEITSGFSISSANASIDGVPVGNLNPHSTPYRACAGPATRCSAPSFSITLPGDSLFSPSLPPGTYQPAVADGAYLLLAPLTPGGHTIKFGGTGYLGGTFSQNITYNVTVLSS